MKEQKVALITGTSSGIGSATAIALAKQNYDIIIHYNNNYNDSQKLKEELESQYHINTLLVKCDLRKEEEIINMVEKSIQKFYHIDILINNAAINYDNDIDTKTKKEFQDIIDVNLIGPFLVSKHVASYMMKQKKGKIINVASTNGIDTYNPISLDYDASKAGIISLTHNLAIAYAPYINVNAVAPGWTNTKIVSDMEPSYRIQEEKKILLQRFANPEEIAKVISFLASDDASYINSEIIRVDGGIYV